MSISLFKRQYLRIVLILCIAGTAAALPCYAEPKPTFRLQNVTMNDPIFEFEYDSSKVHFEFLDTSLLVPSCNKFLSVFDPLPRRLILYAQYKSDTTTIYIADSVPGHEINIFVIRNGICDGGVANFSMRQIHFNPPEPSDSPALTDLELAELFKDTLVRHEKAFGSKAIFLKRLEETVEWRVGGCKASSIRWCSAISPIPAINLELLNNYRKEE